MENKFEGTPNYDWRHLYEGNPVKNQGSCGSCWSFAANGAIEASYRLNKGVKRDLSIQYFLDCDLKDSGCQGGWPTRTFEWVKHNGVLDAKYSPYQNVRTLCQTGKYEKLRENLVKDFEWCEQNEDGKECTKQLWLGLLSKGPLVVAMDGEFEGISKYKPGSDFAPLVPSSCGKVNHAVIAVGFVTENGEDYILVRNSWGTNWGYEGYFKIPASKHCGIMDNGWFPVTQEHQPFPEKACPEFYSECNFGGKTKRTCYGDNNFESSLGGDLNAYQKIVDKNIYFNFYSEKNCKGTKTWNYSDQKCIPENFMYKNSPIKSASVDNIDLPWGCVQHFTEACYGGEATLICDSIPDLTTTDFVFTTGSIMAPTYSVNNLFFFDEPKYQGKGFGIKSKELENYSEDPELLAIMKNAKSVYINVRPPNSPYDPNW